MTERLYLQDAYLATFSAHIVERVLLPGGRLAVILDHTAFYPGTGGLLTDRGWLNRAQVIEVMLRESDGEILHVLSEEIWENQIQARIDWPRRLDAMREHTSGHLLANAFAQVCGAATVGITVSEHEAFLNLDRVDVSPVQVEQAEALANEGALSNRPVRVASVDAAQAGKIGLKAPGGTTWPLQVISIEGTGVTPCSGIHVKQTGEVGLVKVLGHEVQGSRLRVRFACGERALAEFRRVDHALTLIAGSLGVATSNVVPAVAHLAAELNAARAELGTVQGNMMSFEAEVLAASATAIGGARVVQHVYAGRNVTELRQLARLIAARPGLVALLGTAGERAQLVFARSATENYDMIVFIRAAAQMLNSQGGGQPAFAESIPVRADEARVEAAISKARKLLHAQR
jgi:alanyl-tRNA synthetase